MDLCDNFNTFVVFYVMTEGVLYYHCVSVMLYVNLYIFWAGQWPGTFEVRFFFYFILFYFYLFYLRCRQ